MRQYLNGFTTTTLPCKPPPPASQPQPAPRLAPRPTPHGAAPCPCPFATMPPPQVRLVDALLGSQVWRSFHKGSYGTGTKVVGCGRGISAVRARVRAYRSTGARGAPQVGPWSKVSQAMRLRPFVDEEKVEIAEIPGTWAAVDVVGVEDLDERKVGPEELQPFVASLTHPHAHSHTLTPL